MKRRLAAMCLVALFAAACGDSSGVGPSPPALLPIDAATVPVGGTLQIPLPVDNPDGLALTWSYEAPELPSLDSVATLGGTPAGGTFSWTPLVSHVGEHVFTFRIASEAGEDARSVVLTVTTAAEAAPVFVSPGAGATLDLGEKSCLEVAVEVSDADSAEVTLSLGDVGPDGASLEQTAAKSGTLTWCPTPAQVDSALRWSMEILADDGEHAPTKKLFRVILQRPVKEGCAGEAPSVTIEAPDKGEELVSAPGFPVMAQVTDDNPLKDPPVLYFSFEAPADEDKPDLALFEQALFSGTGPQVTARIPDPGLASGEKRVVYVVVGVTDNDDPDGTACDHSVTSPVRRFVAVGAGQGVTLGDCAACGTDDECASGVCASADTGEAYCLPRCGEGCALGSCEETATVSGAVAEACGPVAAVCFPEAPCVNDEHEPNDTLAGATTLQTEMAGVICEDDLDVFAVDLEANQQLLVELSDFGQAEGDLDLALVNEAGDVLTASATANEEEVFVWCAASDQRVYAVVLGYEGATNDYALFAAIGAEECCAADDYEPNDDPNGDPLPPTLVHEDVVEAVICPGDEDWFLFEAGEGQGVDITLAFDHENIDLDLELYDASLERVAFSDGITDESIAVPLPGADLYLLRVFGYAGDTGEYLLELLLTTEVE